MWAGLADCFDTQCLHGSCTPEMPLTSATAPHSADVVDTVSNMETFPETNKRTASYLYTGQTYGESHELVEEIVHHMFGMG